MLDTIIYYASEFLNGYANLFTQFEFSFDHIGMMVALTIWMVAVVGFYGTLLYVIVSGITGYTKTLVMAARKAILSIDTDLREEVRS